MSNKLTASDDARTAIADAITTLTDAGSGPGVVRAYTGTLPSDLDPTGDTLLAEWTLADPAAAAAIAGVATWDFAPDIDATIAATGTPGYFIVFDSDDNPVIGGTIGTSGAAMNFDIVAWVTGGTASLTDGTVTMPNS
jgi:hypothetical protein